MHDVVTSTKSLLPCKVTVTGSRDQAVDIFGRALYSRHQKLLTEVLNCLKKKYVVMLAKLGMLVGEDKIKIEPTFPAAMVETQS